ncbi:MAG: rhodanese-like domain-containing protein [Acidimicrobiia bacterium]
MSFFGHDPVPTVRPDEAHRLSDEGALLVDLGEPRDWFRGRLPHARLIEPENLDLDMRDLPRDRVLVIAGRDPERTAAATAALRECGLDARQLAGGPAAWRRAGYPLIAAPR